MIELHARIDDGPDISAQLNETAEIEGSVAENQSQLSAQVKDISSIAARVLPAVILCACLNSTISLDAQLMHPSEDLVANFITADGYFIKTSDGYLLCVQDS